MNRRIIPRRPVRHHGETDATNPRSKLAQAFDALAKTARLVSGSEKDKRSKRDAGGTDKSGRGRGSSHLDAATDTAVEGSASGGGEGGGGRGEGHGEGGRGGSHGEGGAAGGRGRGEGGARHGESGSGQGRGEGGASQGEGGGSQGRGGGGQGQGRGDGRDGWSIAGLGASDGVLDDLPAALLAARQAERRTVDGLSPAVRPQAPVWSIARIPGAWTRKFPPPPAFDPSAAPASGPLPRTIQRWVKALNAAAYAPGSYTPRPAKPSPYRLFAPPRSSAAAHWPALPTGLALRRLASTRPIAPFAPFPFAAPPVKSRLYERFVPPHRPVIGFEASLLRRLKLENRLVPASRPYTLPGPLAAAAPRPAVPRWLALENQIILPTRPYPMPASAAARAKDVERRIFALPPLPIRGIELPRPIPVVADLSRDGDGRLPPMSMDSLRLLLGLGAEARGSAATLH